MCGRRFILRRYTEVPPWLVAQRLRLRLHVLWRVSGSLGKGIGNVQARMHTSKEHWYINGTALDGGPNDEYNDSGDDG